MDRFKSIYNYFTEAGKKPNEQDAGGDAENVPRNDPNDSYKQNSEDAVFIVGSTPVSEKLTGDDLEMLSVVAADMDPKLPTDELEKFPAHISPESRAQLDRLPTWLRSMIKARWKIIHNHYGHGAHNFLRVIANRIEHQYRNQYLKVIGASAEEDGDGDLIRNQTADVTDLMKNIPNKAETRPNININTAVTVANIVGKFKALHRAKKHWEPHMIKKSETILRTAMITKATAAEAAIIVEDDNIRAVSKKQTDEAESGGEEMETTTNHWDSYDMDEKEQLQEEAREAIETEYHRKSAEQLSRDEKKALKVKEKMVKIEKKKKKVGCWSYCKAHPLFASSSRRKERKRNLLERALYRRYSRIWYKGCGEPIEHTKNSGHQFRADERFSSFIVSLVTWTIFKHFIMFIIVANAVLLAVETGDPSSDNNPIFEILDVFFLSLYTIEFVLKVYAHPYKYWKSGYNVFDFFILMISFVKQIVDWMGYTELSYLKMLQIFRALRVLRGVSLSVQMQVLVTALVETVRTHVISVVILLALMMYIGAVAAYHTFGIDYPSLAKPWGNLGFGMLRMFSFVTMDGWTDITRKFEKENLIVGGRIFGITGIVLGNFLFSSIFIAIIIMNISEATDAHREREREENEVRINRKKDMIYRRQHLTMRQLLARQRVSVSTDFFTVASQFQKLLRHDDLVAMKEVCSSPLWIDCLYKSFSRCHHTANILMNTHREIADHLLEFYQFYGEGRYKLEPISRGRYNRYMKIKAKLALIKNEIYRQRKPVTAVKKPLRIRLPPDDHRITHRPTSKINHK